MTTLPASTERAVRRVTLILNPASGRGQGGARRAEIEQLLTAAAGRAGEGASWSIVETTAPGSATRQAAEAASEGADVVAAAGGDGTLGDVMNGLVGTGAILGLVPMGTGNDFARSLGLAGDSSHRKDRGATVALEELRVAIDALYHGVARPVDLGRIAWDDPSIAPRWFINVAGCGFDAVVAERVNRGYRWLHGTAAYVVAVVGALLAFRAAHMRVIVGEEPLDLRAMLCSIANSRTYGGGMLIAPDAAIDDGLLDLCILQEVGKIEFLRAFPRVFKGTHVTHPKVKMLQGQVIRVESDPPMPILVDGEVMGTTPVTFTAHKHAIQVMTPAPA